MTTSEQTGRVVAVTGGTGFIGQATIRRLVETGHRVRVLARDLQRASGVLPITEFADSIEIIQGDVFNPASLDELCDGANTLVHLVGIRREIRPEVTFERLHVDSTRLVLEAAKRAGIDRIVHMSALGTRPAARSEYHRSKYAAEQLVRSSGLDWTILRPSVVIGPGGFLEMAQQWARGEAAPRFFMPYFEPPTPHSKESLPAGVVETPRMQPISVQDVAKACVAAIDSGDAIGEVYPLGGPRAYEWPELLAAIRNEMGLKKPVWGVPAPVGECVARLAVAARCDGFLPFGLSDVQMACEDNTCSTSKAAEELGVVPAPVSLAG